MLFKYDFLFIQQFRVEKESVAASMDLSVGSSEQAVAEEETPMNLCVKKPNTSCKYIIIILLLKYL